MCLNTFKDITSILYQWECQLKEINHYCAFDYHAQNLPSLVIEIFLQNYFISTLTPAAIQNYITKQIINALISPTLFTLLKEPRLNSLSQTK